ncbi:MAG: PD-(D/E)XK nuclease family protein [Bacteroidota bacterium]
MPVILQHGESPPALLFEDRVRQSRMEGCLVIVPTRRRVRHMMREIMRLTPGAVAPALPLHTLESFCRSLYNVSPDARHVVEGPARTLLFQEAVRAVAPSLRYFTVRGGNVHLPLGTFDRLVEVLVTLKESGISSSDLQEELSLAGEEEHPKLADVAKIYDSYERRLDALALEDLEGIYRALSGRWSQEQFRRAFHSLFPSVVTVSLAGFDEFSVPEIGVIRRVSAVKGLSVTMMFDYTAENRDLFGHLEENYRLLTGFGFREVRGDRERAASAFFFGFSKKPPEAKRAADHLARNLFRRRREAKPADLSSCVTIMAARDRTHEVELICRLIKRLAAEVPGRELHTICVALHRPQLYTDILREQFSRYEIPVNITDRYDLSRSPIVVTLLGLLAIPLRGFRREDVLRVAGSPSILWPSAATPFDAANLSSTAARVRATAGFASWCGRLERAASLADADRAASTDDRDVRRADEEAASYRKAKVDLETIEQTLRPLHGELVPRDFERCVLDIIGSLGVSRRLIAPALREYPDVMERDIRAFRSFCEVLRDVTAMSESQGEGGTPLPLRMHVERLRAAVSRERYNVRERFGRGVLVTSIEETRELPVNVMIVAGLVDGEFPSVYQPEVFLSAHRRALREQRYTWENRYLFYQAATNWTEHLYLTYPLRDGDIELVRSSFVDAVTKCARVRRYETPDENPVASDIGATDEFLRWYIGLAGAEAPVPPGLERICAEVAARAAVEESRMISHARPEFEGRILAQLADDERKALERTNERVFSATQLETYAECPFRYFARAVLRLEAEEEFAEEITAGEKGSAMHEILFEFFTARRERNLPPLRMLSDEEFEAAVREAIAIASRTFDRFDIPDVFWEIEKEAILGHDGTDGLLREFLECERRREEPLSPAYFEVSFGGATGAGGNVDPLLSTPDPVTLGQIRLRGKVDRVDVGDRFFTVIDYKTGSKVPGLKDIREGRSMQLPLYLHAVRELLRARESREVAPAGGFYYRLRDSVELRPGVAAETFRGKAFPARSKYRQFVQDERELQNVIDGASDAAEQAVKGMAGGEFPLTRPELVEEVCGSCDVRTVCRIQTLKHLPKERGEPE